MKEDYTDITVILDRSGSMAAIKDDAIGGLQHFVNVQKKVPGQVLFTMVQFDDVYEVVQHIRQINSISSNEEIRLDPRGSTALLDAIGKTILDKGRLFEGMREEERPAKIVIVIVTDGAENSSQEFTLPQIHKLITEQREKYNWEFVFIGANQDAIKTGTSLGIGAQNSMTMAYSGIGTKEAFGAVARNVAQYSSGASLDASFSIDQQKRQDNLQKGIGK